MLWFLKIAHFLLVCVGSATAVYCVLLDSMLGLSLGLVCTFGSGYCLHYLTQIEVRQAQEKYFSIGLEVYEQACDIKE